MRISILSCIFSLIILSPAFAQRRGSVALHTSSGSVYGTLTLPGKVKGASPLVIIIAGSGPTDRDGNNMVMKNNSLRMLSDSLAKHGIASLRFDKRGIGASKAAAPDESKLLFSDYIADIKGWIGKYKNDRRFDRIFIAGHSEGSLIGMVAIKDAPVTGFISIAGTGKPANEVMMAQLAASGSLTKEMLDTSRIFFAKLRNEGHIENVPGGFYQSLFRTSVQPYLASWIKFDPRVEIAAVAVPTLIIQGTTDMQVDTAQAYGLLSSKPNASLVIIPGMNHIFKDAPNELALNYQTYNEPALPIKTELVKAITSFIKGTPRRR